MVPTLTSRRARDGRLDVQVGARFLGVAFNSDNLIKKEEVMALGSTSCTTS